MSNTKQPKADDLKLAARILFSVADRENPRDGAPLVRVAKWLREKAETPQ